MNAEAGRPLPAFAQTARKPWDLPAQGWLAAAKRAWAQAGEDNIALIAAGVAFYGFLAMIPLMGAIVLSYGLVADPAAVVTQVHAMTTVMPADAAKLIGEQLLAIVHASGGKSGFGLLLALALALYGAMQGATAIMTALNIAFEVGERRSFVRRTLLALTITAVAVVVALIAVVAIAALGVLDRLVADAPTVVVLAGKALPYLVLLGVGAAAAATLYRYGPDHDRARWTWMTPGSVLATLLWALATLGFGIYVASFGNYNATYGSLGAVVVLLTWLYLSAYSLLLGAELNAELERVAGITVR